jgi:hypothetical protein
MLSDGPLWVDSRLSNRPDTFCEVRFAEAWPGAKVLRFAVWRLFPKSRYEAPNELFPGGRRSPQSERQASTWARLAGGNGCDRQESAACQAETSLRVARDSDEAQCDAPRTGR